MLKTYLNVTVRRAVGTEGGTDDLLWHNRAQHSAVKSEGIGSEQ